MSHPAADAPPASARQTKVDLFLVSLLILFLELACIRWFPAHVIFLTFFTNVVLLASFLGMSVGCLTASHSRNYITLTPLWLAIAFGLVVIVEVFMQGSANTVFDLGGQARPDVVFFGTEHGAEQLDRVSIPMEVVCGVFFLLVALGFVGPGQMLGRLMTQVPDRVLAYSINIAGSLIGIILFAALSWLEIHAFAWVSLVSGLLIYLMWRHSSTKGRPARTILGCLPLAVVLAATLLHSNATSKFLDAGIEFRWSPYYRIDYLPPAGIIVVNLIGHQTIQGPDYSSPEYALPHLLMRDVAAQSGASPSTLDNVLIIGAGSGNDVSRALEWGAKHVDAVEIDPVIQRIGARDHPLRPYQDPRVSVHLGDGRNFLRSTKTKYDLIIYALVDSLVLHSSYSNIRLESYLFTRQAFEDIQRCLKPDGLFVTYNYFRQGWIVMRLALTLDDVFGADNSLVFAWPFRAAVPADEAFSGFGIVFAGPGAARLRRAFGSEGREYWLPIAPPARTTANGFEAFTAQADKLKGATDTEILAELQRWWRFAPAQVVVPASPPGQITDDWPFLYVRRPMLPMRPVVSGMLVMGSIALALVVLVLKQAPAAVAVRPKSAWTFDAGMFFLGAGFMLVETKAVVSMALLLGSTWIVNSLVFFAVLVMILLANVFVVWARPEKLWPYYLALFAALALNVVVPLDLFLGWPTALRMAASCLLVFAPIGLAGVVFATLFRRTRQPDMALGSNIAGAMLGGLSENLSMLIGFQYLGLVALLFYALSLRGCFSRQPDHLDSA